MSDLTEWVREEQASLWYDLNDAVRFAANGSWSIRSANVARRIVEAARLVGPTPYGEIPYSLVAGGVYAAVLEAGGIAHSLPDEAEWRRLDEVMEPHGTTRALCQPELAGTVAAIDDPRERRWIRDGEE